MGRSYQGVGGWIFGVSTVAEAAGVVIVWVCAYKLEAETHENTAKKNDSFRTAVLHSPSTCRPRLASRSALRTGEVPRARAARRC